jgi:putative inorganic carbon (HCO3(-)) transporter
VVYQAPTIPTTIVTSATERFQAKAVRLAQRCYGLHLWTIFGIALSNIFLGLTGVATALGSPALRVPWRRMRQVMIPLGMYAFLIVVSVLTSYDSQLSLPKGRELLSLGTLFLGLILIRGESEVRRIVDGIIVLAALLSLFGLGQMLFGFGDINNRIRGPFSHYMTFAGVLLMADLLLVAQMFYGKTRAGALRWAALILINLALVMGLTRSAWVALILALTILLVVRAPKLLAAYIPATLLFLVLAPVPVIHRVQSIPDLTDISNYDRLCMAEAALYMIRERPLFGLGPGMVAERYPIYRHPTAPRQEVPHLHNAFLQTAAEEGLLALACYLWIMAATLLLAYRGFRHDESTGGQASDLYLGVFLALLAFNFAGLFEDNWGDTEVQRIALFIVAIPYCLMNGEKDSPEPSPELSEELGS